MHSKYKIWDYSKRGDSIDLSHSPCFINLFDPAIRFKVQESLTKSLEGVEVKLLQARDITSSWVDDNLNSLSLFGTDESFIITDGESLAQDVKDLLMELGKQGSLDKKLIIFFNKTDSFFTKLSKDKGLNTVSIIAPAFWEFDILLDYICEQEGVSLSFEAKQSVLEYVNHGYIDFFNIIHRAKVSYGEESVSAEKLSELMDKSRVDNFQFAGLFGFKKKKEFYQKLVDLSPNKEEIRSLFYFLQTHLLKLSHVDNIYGKAKMSKYDKQLISQSKLWSKREISLAMGFLKDIEVKAKLKYPYLENELKNLYLKSIV